MARRAGVWVLGGAAAATGVLLAAPDAYAWLRAKAGLAGGDPEDAAAAIEHEDEHGTFDTRAARLSLRARLSESSEAETAVSPPLERPLAARPRPKREDVEPMRRAVDEARARVLDTARQATRENAPEA